ncbi:hypothetical protein [Nocardioides bruguierae]|uniref:Uncharacterized protein n=1 Tax=Nocardioides bruguierae TaxID=2945102 RepID=A0A9X2DCF5_9ACTN|nr:hypothetical protein [Nocardioides bruguierae]MCM0622817.1 hypothetical protein [Nocardioides bruguierae]
MMESATVTFKLVERVPQKASRKRREAIARLTNSGMPKRAARRVDAVSRPIASGVTGDSGYFAARSTTSEEVGSLQPDGTVQVEITVWTPEMVRYYWVDVEPQDLGDVSTSGRLATIHVAPSTASTLLIAGERGVVETVEGPAALSRALSSNRVAMSDEDTVVATNPDSIDGEMSADEAADVAADELAYQNGTMDQTEEQLAAEERDSCSTGDGETWWQDVDGVTQKRRIPLVGSYIKNKFYPTVSLKKVTTTKMEIAVTGAGPNYAGGLTTSESSKVAAEAVATRDDKKNVNYLWRAVWKYQKQERWCFGGGYPYKTGRTRWVPSVWMGGACSRRGQHYSVGV